MVVVLIVVFTERESKEKEIVKIGALLSLSGDAAYYGDLSNNF